MVQRARYYKSKEMKIINIKKKFDKQEGMVKSDWSCEIKKMRK